MAVFPEGNPGAYPLDPTSPVGRFRILYGDTSYVPLDPPVPGMGSYQELSDAEIEGFIAQGGDSVPRGIGYLYIALAGQAAKQSKAIQDQDLRVDLTKRAADLRAIADVWFGSADNDDLASAEEAFEIVPTGTRGGFVPEGTRPIFGRQYTWGPAPRTAPSVPSGGTITVETFEQVLGEQVKDTVAEYLAAHPPSAGTVWTQSVPSESWVITHTFARVPDVAIYVAGEQVDADITATSTTVTVAFPTPTAGIAVLN